jgi:TolB-like protein
VYPFENNAVSGRERLAFLAHWLPDVVSAELREASGLRLVERQELLRLLEEQKIGTSELAAKETRLRLGRLAGAQTLVFGGFTAVGEELSIDARLVDAESGAVLRSATVRGPTAEARRLGRELAAAVARDLGVDVSRRAAAAGLVDDRALRAAELFYEGLALEKRGETDRAAERYRQVLELDRNDEEARRRLKSLLGAR